MHALGYFSKELSIEEKANFLGNIERFKEKKLPFSALLARAAELDGSFWCGVLEESDHLRAFSRGSDRAVPGYSMRMVWLGSF